MPIPQSMSVLRIRGGSSQKPPLQSSKHRRGMGNLRKRSPPLQVGNVFMLGAGGVFVVAFSAYFGRYPVLFWFMVFPRRNRCLVRRSHDVPLLHGRAHPERFLLDRGPGRRQSIFSISVTFMPRNVALTRGSPDIGWCHVHQRPLLPTRTRAKSTSGPHL